MAVITTGAHPKALWPGVKTFFGQTYDAQPKVWEKIYGAGESSDQAYEEDVESYSFGLAVEKAQGASVTYDEHKQGYTARYTHATYALGYIVTEEELSDNLYEKQSFKRAKMLAQSLAQTKEFNGAFPFNTGFDGTNYPYHDGVAWFSASHPTPAGLQSNLLTAANFSEAALEDAMITISLTRNARGHIMHTQAELLLIHPNDWFNAVRVLDSPLTTTDSGNSINATRKAAPIEFVKNPFFTDTDAWFIKTNHPEGVKLYQRWKYKFDQDNDFDTSNAKAKARERYKFGSSDWRGMFGNAG